MANTLEYDLQSADYTAYQKHFTKKLFQGYFIFYFIIVAIILILILNTSYIITMIWDTFNLVRYKALALVTFPWAVIIIFLVGSRVRLNSLMRETVSAGGAATGPFQLTLNDDEVVTKGRFIEARVNLAACYPLEQDKTMIYIPYEPAMAVPIPKQAFPNQESMARFVAECNSAIASAVARHEKAGASSSGARIPD